MRAYIRVVLVDIRGIACSVAFCRKQRTGAFHDGISRAPGWCWNIQRAEACGILCFPRSCLIDEVTTREPTSSLKKREPSRGLRLVSLGSCHYSSSCPRQAPCNIHEMFAGSLLPGIDYLTASPSPSPARRRTLRLHRRRREEQVQRREERIRCLVDGLSSLNSEKISPHTVLKLVRASAAAAGGPVASNYKPNDVAAVLRFPGRSEAQARLPATYACRGRPCLAARLRRPRQ
jgi:hypothetical protein